MKRNFKMSKIITFNSWETSNDVYIITERKKANSGLMLGQIKLTHQSQLALTKFFQSDLKTK